ncbi:acyltransferase domain-containing protein [Amycolatopsis sp. NPDC003865]
MTTSAATTDRVLLLAAPDLDGILTALDSREPRNATYRGPGPRLGLVDPTPDLLATARRLIARGTPVRRRSDLWFSPAPLLAGSGRTAFIFPGLEGEFEPQVADVAKHLGTPVPELSAKTLGRHGAAVMAVGRLLDTALRRLAVRPDAVAGHSVGEWTAMITGGIVSGAEFDALVDTADLDALRVPGVEFAVLGCDATRAEAAIADRPDVVISHENSTNQTVVCGPAAALSEVTAALRAQKVICRPLPFRSGFHTPMLEPYLRYFRDGLPALRMRQATTPVWSATTAAPFPDEPDAARALCLRHLVERVRFRQVVRALYTDGVRAFVQAGPGQLGSLIDDTLRHDLAGAEFLVLAANSPHRAGLDQLRRCAVALWTEGADPDFSALDRPAPAVSRPTPVAASQSPGAAKPHLPAPAGVTGLAALGTPLADEMARFLDDTATSVAAVLRAAGPAESLDVSLAAMPYLLDHCLMRQRPGWPDVEDLRPLVPATTMVTHMLEAAERAYPGLTAVAAEDLTFHRWLPAFPPRRVPVTVQPSGPGRAHVRLGEHAEGTIELAHTRPPAPPSWAPEPGERSPKLAARDLYEQGWLFHGPAFQGMTRSIAVSDRSMRGVITVPPAPGALLDNLGQYLGQWLVETVPDRYIALPARITRIEWHAPEPAPGSTVDCFVRVTGLDSDTVTMDGQLRREGVPIVSVRGWVDRRFDGDERTGLVHREPGTATLSERRTDGLWSITERWRTLSSRDFYLRRYTSAEEYAEYERLPPIEQRAWFLKLAVVKDAVRGRLWDDGAGPVHPAELRVHQDPSGRCRVTGRHGLEVPDLDIAVARLGAAAVARVRPAGSTPNPIEIAEGPAPAGGTAITAGAGSPGYHVLSH